VGFFSRQKKIYVKTSLESTPLPLVNHESLDDNGLGMAYTLLKALNNNHSLTPISPRAEQDSGFTEREGESPRLFIGIYILFSWYFFKLYFKRTQELPTSLDPQQPRFNSGGKGDARTNDLRPNRLTISKGKQVNALTFYQNGPFWWRDLNTYTGDNIVGTFEEHSPASLYWLLTDSVVDRWFEHRSGQSKDQH
jgi:hypothetical protein